MIANEEHTLLDLAQKIEAVGREHACWSQAHQAVMICTGYLRALDHIQRMNERDHRRDTARRE